MTRRAAGFAALIAALLGASGTPAVRAQSPSSTVQAPQDPTLAADLDRLFTDPTLARALVGIRIESLTSGRLLYERNGQKLVVPASNMRICWGRRARVAARSVGSASASSKAFVWSDCAPP